MQIKEIQIKNFRSIIDCTFQINGLLALVGKNNNGKSNIIDAIEMFLNKNKANTIYDFNDHTMPIEIDIIFDNLSLNEASKLNKCIENNNLILKKRFTYSPKENGDFDSKSSLYYLKDSEEYPTKGQNFFTGELLPELYKIPAVKELKDETKIASTTYFGKFLDLVFESNDYNFDKLDLLLENIKEELKRDDSNAPLVKSAKEIEKIMCEQFKDCSLAFKIKTPNRKDIINQLEIFADDGCDTPLINKGHGTQRAFIFSILLLYAQKLNNKISRQSGKEKKSIIIVMEEPEIYLHPHQQRIIYNLFKSLISSNDQIQIIYTTHSSFMINIEDYKQIGFVHKNTSNGTKISQCNEDIFDENEKYEFSTACQFDPERNEMFFADKIIFCEGDTEKYALPVIFNKLNINLLEKRISIIECGSKSTIPLFLKILNKLNNQIKQFDYYVIHDLDIPPKKFKDELDKKKLEDKAIKDNQLITSLISQNKIFAFDPDFERFFSLDVGSKNKPYYVKKKLLEMSAENFPTLFKNFITKNFR